MPKKTLWAPKCFVAIPDTSHVGILEIFLRQRCAANFTWHVISLGCVPVYLEVQYWPIITAYNIFSAWAFSVRLSPVPSFVQWRHRKTVRSRFLKVTHPSPQIREYATFSECCLLYFYLYLNLFKMLIFSENFEIGPGISCGSARRHSRNITGISWERYGTSIKRDTTEIEVS